MEAVQGQSELQAQPRPALPRERRRVVAEAWIRGGGGNDAAESAAFGLQAPALGLEAFQMFFFVLVLGSLIVLSGFGGLTFILLGVS